MDRFFSGQWNFEGASCSKILLVLRALIFFLMSTPVLAKHKYHDDISLIYIALNVHINSHMIEDYNMDFSAIVYIGRVTWGWMSSEFFLMSLR